VSQATITQAYRFALAPTVEQEQFLSSCCGASRFWFNQGLSLVKQRLDERQAGDETVQVPWSYKALCSAFRGDAIKDEICPWRSEVVVGCQQAGLEQLGRALQNFSAGRQTGRNVGFPRFRSKGRCHESVIFQRPRLRDARHVELDRRLGPIRCKERLSKFQKLLADDPNARVLRSTIQRQGRTWFISFQVERSPKQRRARRPREAVGIDVGLSRLAMLSTGESVENSRPLQGSLRKLRRLQRRLDRQRRANNPSNYDAAGRAKKGVKNWVKSGRMSLVEADVLRLHVRVANLRCEQSHQLTTALTREFGVIGVESLAVSNLLRNKRLARHISDVGWGMILAQLAYKTSWSDGSVLVAADRFYPSSKTCSSCGSVKAKLGLGERVFTCEIESCGLVIDRDLNAAINLARMAEQYTQGEGLDVHVAATEVETRNARGGQVSPGSWPGRSPLKREACSQASQRREALAHAA